MQAQERVDVACGAVTESERLLDRACLPDQLTCLEKERFKSLVVVLRIIGKRRQDAWSPMAPLDHVLVAGVARERGPVRETLLDSSERRESPRAFPERELALILSELGQ